MISFMRFSLVSCFLAACRRKPIAKRFDLLRPLVRLGLFVQNGQAINHDHIEFLGSLFDFGQSTFPDDLECVAILNSHVVQLLGCEAIDTLLQRKITNVTSDVSCSDWKTESKSSSCQPQRRRSRHQRIKSSPTTAPFHIPHKSDRKPQITPQWVRTLSLRVYKKSACADFFSVRAGPIAIGCE